jgi:ABC-type polysaccharide/polyol phosphate transport system ATPase subunit
MIKLTLCPKVLEGDIPSYEVENEEQAIKMVNDWVSNIKLTETVIVAFENFRGLEIEQLRNEQTALMVSHDWADIIDYCEAIIMSPGQDRHETDLSLFAFENYQEALKYCIDLKESF